MVALFITWVPLPAPFPESFSNGRNLIAAITTGIIAAIWLFIYTVRVIRYFVTKGRLLDDALNSRHFKQSSYLLFGRRYIGEIRKRRIDIQFLPAHRGEPAKLEIFIQANNDFKGSVGVRRSVVYRERFAEIETAGTPFEGLRVFTNNESIARQRLFDDRIATLFQRLIKPSARLPYREINIQTGRIWYHVRLHNISSSELLEWLDDLVELTDLMEPL